MAPAHITVLLSQKPSTKHGIIRRSCNRSFSMIIRMNCVPERFLQATGGVSPLPVEEAQAAVRGVVARHEALLLGRVGTLLNESLDMEGNGAVRTCGSQPPDTTSLWHGTHHVHA